MRVSVRHTVKADRSDVIFSLPHPAAGDIFWAEQEQPVTFTECKCIWKKKQLLNMCMDKYRATKKNGIRPLSWPARWVMRWTVVSPLSVLAGITDEVTANIAKKKKKKENVALNCKRVWQSTAQRLKSERSRVSKKGASRRNMTAHKDKFYPEKYILFPQGRGAKRHFCD